MQTSRLRLDHGADVVPLGAFVCGEVAVPGVGGGHARAALGWCWGRAGTSAVHAAAAVGASLGLGRGTVRFAAPEGEAGVALGGAVAERGRAVGGLGGGGRGREAGSGSGSVAVRRRRTSREPAGALVERGSITQLAPRGACRGCRGLVGGGCGVGGVVELAALAAAVRDRGVVPVGWAGGRGGVAGGGVMVVQAGASALVGAWRPVPAGAGDAAWTRWFRGLGYRPRPG